jgi:ectoine hydroxylase-related dioxygenase (phytanoyl-CoA dioxygenase family)
MMKRDADVQSHGVSKQSVASDALQLCIEEIRRNGCSTLVDVFTRDEMDAVRLKIDQIYATQAAELSDARALESAQDEDIVRCPLAYDPTFLQMAVHKKIQSVMRAVLGDAFVLIMQNAIINRADRKQYQVRWHRDLNYQHWVCTQPLALNFLVCVDDFTIDGGCTWVLPGSHQVAEFPSDAYVRKFEAPMELKSGSVIVLDAMTYHRAGFNKKPGFVRRAVNHVVGLPFVAQQIDIPRLLAERSIDYSGDQFLAAFLGYRWNASPNPAAWRSARQHRPR